MFHDIIASLISFFLIDPLHKHVAEALAEARAPQEVVSQVASCVANSGPALVERAIQEPWWAASTAGSLWVGWAEPRAVIAEAAPGCAGPIERLKTD